MEQNGSNKKSSAQITTVTSINLESDIKVRRYDCKWTINNFRFCCTHDVEPDSDDDSIESQHFNTDGLEWSIDLFPLSYFSGYLSAHLYCCTGDDDLENSKLEQVHATMSIINNLGEEVCTQQKMSTKEKLVQTHGLRFDRIVESSILYDEDKGLLPNNQLTLLCKVTINETAFLKPDDNVKNTVNERRLIEFDDFERLLEDRNFSDVRIIVGDKTFHAHKAVLSVRSSVFASIFNHVMKEQKIEIPDLDEEVVGQLLLFLYSGRVDLNKIQRLASKLVAVADEYDVAGLKIICEQALIENLKVDNVAEVLQVADKHGSKRLCEAVFEFLRERRRGLPLVPAVSDDAKIEAIFSSLSPEFLAKLIRSLLDKL
ncbi:speckle-type POZ protein B-like [Nasonia vitripennis]|uniref:Uncharacterized protein n=1 Tax=Nasonia vitripennis TaxID=7425 RepID=A0A7M7H374_NASVI|nr:speckle-type POZ protein B-like [Nasonia vitripennis]